MNQFEHLGIKVPNILLPKDNIDYQKWAVIACDQFTSQPEYWSDVENFVGDEPSTLNMILPEVYLESDDEEIRIEKTKSAMAEYRNEGIFK
jgi:hypothetical protein